MIKLTSKQWNTINEAVYTINAERSLDKLRLDILSALDSLIPHDKSFFDLAIRKQHKVAFFDPISNNMEQRYMDLYFEEYEACDPMFWFFSQNRSEIYRSSDFVSEATQNVSLYNSGWLEPQDIYYSIGSMVVYGGILYGSVNLWRSKTHGDFSDEEVQIMTVINRHLSLRLGTWFPNGMHRSDDMEYASELSRLYGLTPREVEIANLIYSGHSIREMSALLFISQDTVKKHTTHVYKKLGVDSRLRLVNVMRGLALD
ncbi:MAG: helix-turn-helix transcriptional regulator [Clostridiales Family XIII bacterium]|nr:helix-turn-helix transcriptional regulator [Clostridiales Family XIII bacterium]